MPRAFSLKKTSTSNAKNQKAITHFFTTNPINQSQEKGILDNHQDVTETGKLQKKYGLKRKADSPNKPENQVYYRDSLNLLKKLKKDINHDHKVVQLQNSLQKSGADNNILPEKELSTDTLFFDNNTVATNSDNEHIKLSQNIQKLHSYLANKHSHNSNDTQNSVKTIFENDIEADKNLHNVLKNTCANIKSPKKDLIKKKLFLDNEKLLSNNDEKQLLASMLNKIQESPAKVQSSTCKSALKEDYYAQDVVGKHFDTVLIHGAIIENQSSSPKKNIKGIICVSPKSNSIKTQSCNNSSPSKSGSTAKIFECNDQDIDMFDNWEFDIEEDIQEDLDLSVMQRCEVLSVKRHQYKQELKLKNGNNIGTCFIEGTWLNTPLDAGEIISVAGSRDPSGFFSVNNTSGLLALRPDHLISSTSVVAGVFCKRKAILQERWRGIDSANTAMTIGILIHELVQKALTQHITNVTDLGSECDKIIKESIQMLYDAGITETEARSNMEIYIQPLSDFMCTYVASNANVSKSEKRNWNGKIEKVLDIEENVCCPELGLKGKIDATLQVAIHERGVSKTAIVPLELKSGRASVSAEHRGQLVLYGMMLSLQNQEDPATALQRGLLLYLKERIELREVSCGYPERRDLMMLRNELVQHLAAGPQVIDTDNLVDIEDASRLLQQSMPEPVHHPKACSTCPYLTLCSLHLWHTDGPTVSESHPLAKLRDEALGHLSPQHIKYFLHWTSLLKLEEKGQLNTAPLHALWTESAEKRAKRGVCAMNLKLKSVTCAGDRFSHIFVRQPTNAGPIKTSDRPTKGPQEGEFSIVSVEKRPWIAAGVVTLSNSNELHIMLERDLSRRLNKSTLYQIDTYESYATIVQNLTNLGVLIEDSDRALRLRNLIIDKTPPEFVPKLPREVGRLGSKLMRSLNIEQQRAVLKALACEHYMLLRGLPGTGKTQTISVLIQMLVALKHRVLVTAHTHSAVDTVLSRLPQSLRVMRLGAVSRVAPSLLPWCEHTLSNKCHSTEQLAQLYDSMEVVGVTCLGAGHPMLARTTFDVCIVDEATQVLQCTVLRPLFAAKRFVLVGDPEQLPPVVRSKSARRLGMEESLFHRLIKDDATCTLRLQYRMNQALVEVANKVAYNNSLKCANQSVACSKLNMDIRKISQHSEKSPWLIAACSPEFEDAAVFLNTIICTENSYNEKVFINNDEACIVIDLVETFKQGGVLPSDIGIIAPYRDQVSLLRRVLSGKGVEVSTIDQFQGRDKSVIVYSCTKRDGSDKQRSKEGEILNDQRRLAVSVTRAKHKLIVVGNLRVLQRYTPLMKLIETCKTINLEEDIITRLNEKYGSMVT